MPKTLPVWITTVENSSKDGNTRLSYLPPENSVCRPRAIVKTGHGTTDWFKSEKEYIEAVYCYPVFI